MSSLIFINIFGLLFLKIKSVWKNRIRRNTNQTHQSSWFWTLQIGFPMNVDIFLSITFIVYHISQYFLQPISHHWYSLILCLTIINCFHSMIPLHNFSFLINLFKSMRTASKIVKCLITSFSNLNRNHRISVIWCNCLYLYLIILTQVYVIRFIRWNKSLHVGHRNVSNTDQLVT